MAIVTRYCLGLIIHFYLLAVCLITVLLMTLTRGFVQWFHESTLNASSVSISPYDIQPVIPVGVHVLLLAIGMFVPAMSGLFWTCKKRPKSLKLRIRVAHVVFLIAGIVSVCVLTFSQAVTLYETVNCSLILNDCVCGIHNAAVSNDVCACKELRRAYFGFLVCGLIGQLLSLAFVAKLIPVTLCRSTTVDQEPGVTEEKTTGQTIPSQPPLSSNQTSAPDNKEDEG